MTEALEMLGSPKRGDVQHARRHREFGGGELRYLRLPEVISERE